MQLPPAVRGRAGMTTDTSAFSRKAALVAVSRIAVLYDAPPGVLSHPWQTAHSRKQVAMLMADADLTFDYFPVCFAGTNAGAGITAAFAGIAAAPDCSRPDLVLVVGGPAVHAEIAVIHQVLAPCILAAPMAVFTALGADDAETILGDSACRVFPGVHAMLAAVAEIIDAGRVPVEQLYQRIRSLGRFLLAQQAAESRILVEALLLPALCRQHEHQIAKIRQAGEHRHTAAQLLKLRLVREEAMLEQVRARIGIELARLAQRRASVALGARGVAQMRHLRLGMLCGLLCLIGILWWTTTVASTVFFSGCALVLGSAIYVALSNRIIDSSAAEISPRAVTIEPHGLTVQRANSFHADTSQRAAGAGGATTASAVEHIGLPEAAEHTHRNHTKELHAE